MVFRPNLQLYGTGSHGTKQFQSLVHQGFSRTPSPAIVIYGDRQYLPRRLCPQLKPHIAKLVMDYFQNRSQSNPIAAGQPPVQSPEQKSGKDRPLP